MGTANPAYEARLRIRNQQWQGNTAGMAPGYVQGNLMILPKDLASEFLLFCQRNPQPCPVLAVSEPGNPMIPASVRIWISVPISRVTGSGRTV